jgi:hypothetical protein
MENWRRANPACGYSRDQIKYLVEQGLTGEEIVERFATRKHKYLKPAVRGKRGKYKPSTKPRGPYAQRLKSTTS